jgi:magnesium chelatase subunit D
VTPEGTFPFSAVVGHDDVKTALLLGAIDPAIGGVLLRGHKGSAKSTLARALAGLLPGAPFIDLPIGATEDRVIGSLDVTTALTEGALRFRPGLLAAAHGGVLYIDEVNLLPDHLVDALLDVAASGVNRVEREGVAHAHACRFVLIGSMNPEEGELRPQFLDRFGLAADVVSLSDPSVRSEAVRRRLDFDADPTAFGRRWAPADDALAARLAAARSAALRPADLEAVSTLCARVGAEGLRADLVMARAAAALAGWEGREEISPDDLRRVAPLALRHRARRSPLDAPDEGGALDDALEELLAGSDGGRVAVPDPPQPVVRLTATAPSAAPVGRRAVVEGDRGRLVRTRPLVAGDSGAVAVPATVRAAVARGGAGRVSTEDLRTPVRQHRAANLVVLVVDASGSMGVNRRMEAAKGAVVSLLLDAYQRRDRVALITFRGDEATVALQPTGSVEVARARLNELPTGGRTPLAAGIERALDVARAATSGASAYQPLLVFVTDGRATSAPDGTDPVAAARTAATAVQRQGVDAVVIDAEDGPARLGLARELAETMGARWLTMNELSAPTLAGAVRAVLADSP